MEFPLWGKAHPVLLFSEKKEDTCSKCFEKMHSKIKGDSIGKSVMNFSINCL